ncbi:MAG: hypothetical protein QGH40_15165 [bacterium]|jgi:HEAT repeat protein|nr:hypothetical protein [bacterium]
MDKSQFERCEEVLTGRNNSESLEQVVDKLGLDGTPRSIDLLLKTLRQPEFSLKEQVLKVLLNIDQALVYQGLSIILKQSSVPLREELVQLATQLNAASILLDKMEHWSTELRKIESLIAGITILGFLKAPNTTEPIASYLYHLDSNVKKTAVDSLRSLNSPECLKYVFAPPQDVG